MGIPVDKLLAIETIVVHGNCPDGLSAAIILDDVLPGREIIHAIHKVTPLEAKPHMLFCDISPPRERAEEFRKAGTIVLDHHKSVKDLVASFELHAFGDEKDDPGVSGAVLAYREVWLPLIQDHPSHRHYPGVHMQHGDFQPDVVERFARLAGIRDTWQRQDPAWHEACVQGEAVTFYPVSYWLNTPHPLGMLRRNNRILLQDRLAVGTISLERKLEGAHRTSKQLLYFTSSKGTKVAVAPNMWTSDAADLSKPDTQLFIGFGYTVEQGQKRLLISTRSRNGYDCSKFCVFYGGGGHTGAAGCTLDIQPAPGLGSSNPYDTIREMVERFESA